MLTLLFNLIYIIFSFGLLFSEHICNASHSSIVVDNGYKGVVIAFSPEINTIPSDIIDKTQVLIKSASDILYEATGGRAYFSQVTLLVPENWTGYVNDPNLSPFTRYSDADIIITEKGSDAHSFTMQFGGCGEPALPIVMSKELVLGTGDKYGDTAKLLVHEWAHYRYGVFNEFGFPSDPLYPAYYSIPGSDSNDTQVTACTDGQNVFNFTTNDGCQMTTNHETGLPNDKKCIPLPLIDSNTMQSSLMYTQSIKSITKFCGFDENKIVHNHNVNSPNKQNVLCNGKDTWSVIKSHLESERSVHSNKTETQFKIWRDSEPRTLIAIAKSEAMSILQRSEWINIALTKFTKIDLPKYKAALLTFNGDKVDKLSKTEFWKNGEDLQTTITFNGAADQIDFEKVLKKGKEEFIDKSGGTFIILIGGIGIKSSNQIQQITNIAKQLRSVNIKLKIIVYPVFGSSVDRKHASELFKTAISITGGSIVYIREDKISQKSSVSTLTQLLNAFGSVQKDYSGNYMNSYYMIGEQMFNKPRNTISFDFYTDSSILNKQLRTYFIQSKAGLSGGILDKVNLTDPNGGYNYNEVNFANLNHMRGYIIPLSSTGHIGHWKLSAEAPTNALDESIIAIAEYESNSLNKESIGAKCWLSSVGDHDPSKPLLVYVQITQGLDVLIQDASVKINLTRENIENSHTYELLDDGSGDPDITKGDGIYSQYIVDIKNEGYYFITATVRENNGKVEVTKNFGSTSLPVKHDSKLKSCCGSKIDGDSEERNGSFSRIIDCGSILVTNNFNTENYPPNTIRDLRIEKVNNSNRTVNLLWTSPGGDYTFNEVNRYEIKAFHGSDNDPNLRNDIKDKFDSKKSSDVQTIRPISVAQKYGSQQRAEIRVKSEEGGMYYFAIKSFDKENHGSQVSNIVVAHIKIDGNGGGSAKFAGMEWWEILAICIACAVVLIIVIIIAICFVGKRRRKNDENDRSVEQPPQRRAPDPPRISPPLLKSESIQLDNGSLTHSVDKIPNGSTYSNTNNNYNSGSQQNLRELNVSALSPVQSWDAKDLLSHWGRVQEAKQRQETPPVMRIEDIESGSSNHSPSYASSEDENTATYTSPGTWRYQDAPARPAYVPNSYPEPAFRSSLDPLRSNTPSDNSIPRYSTVNRKPTTTVSQV